MAHDASDQQTTVTVETLKPEEDVVYISPETQQDVFFADHFDSQEAFEKRWTKSQVRHSHKLTKCA
jgi:hypothetical protein